MPRAYAGPRSTGNTRAEELVQEVDLELTQAVAEDQGEHPGKILFVSSAAEAETYDFRIGDVSIEPFWDSTYERLIWPVPEELADRAEAHFFVQQGRIVRTA